MLDTDPRTKLMLDKLTEQSSKGFIEGEWSEKFIWDLKKKVTLGYPLSDKQVSKLEELFERY